VVLNFEILGRTVFPFFSNPHGPNVTFQGIIHPFIYGLFLVPFFIKLLPVRAQSLRHDPRMPNRHIWASDP